MTELKNLKVYTQSNGKVWVAATGKSPYFCFIGETEQDVLARAKSALAFYRSAPERVAEQARARDSEAQRFELKGKVQARDLVAA